MCIHVKLFVVVSFFVWVVIAGSTSTFSQDETVIKVETSVINVPFVVTNKDGSLPKGLTKEDFELIVNGKPKPIDFFDDKGVVNIAIIIDANSNTSEVLGRIKGDAQEFIDLLGADEMAMVIRLDVAGYRVMCDLSSDRRKLREAIAKIDSSNQRSRLMDAVLHQTIFYELGAKKGRKGVVVFGDPDSSISWFEIKPEPSYFTPDFLAQSDSTVYPIFYQTFTLPREIVGKTLSFDQLMQISPIKNFHYYARLTGGRVHIRGAGDFKSAIHRVMHEIRSQYVLGFYIPEDAEGKAGDVSIKSSNKDLTVRAKRNVTVSKTEDRIGWVTRLMVTRKR